MSTDASVEALLSGLTRPLLILPTLQALQEHFGYVPDSSLTAVAQACGVSRADVYGVLTYYSDLRTSPPPAVPVRLCGAEACQAMGARELRAEWLRACQDDPALAERTGVNEPVACLGNCALGPAAMVAGRLVGRASVPRIVELVASAGGRR